MFHIIFFSTTIYKGRICKWIDNFKHIFIWSNGNWLQIINLNLRPVEFTLFQIMTKIWIICSLAIKNISHGTRPYNQQRRTRILFVFQLETRVIWQVSWYMVLSRIMHMGGPLPENFAIEAIVDRCTLFKFCKTLHELKILFSTLCNIYVVVWKMKHR